MKKILIVLFLCIGSLSYGQSKLISGYKKFTSNKSFDNNTGLSFGALMMWKRVVTSQSSSVDNKGNITIEARLRRGGVGFDYYEHLPYNDDYKKRVGYGLYYITPSIKFFDLQIGFGVLSHKESMQKWVTTNNMTYVNSYYRKDGTYVSGYYRRTGGTSSSLESYWGSTGASVYGIIGATKSFYLFRGVDLEAKSMIHITKFGVEPTLGVGLKLSAYNNEEHKVRSRY